MYVFWIAVAGAAGTLARYFLSRSIQAWLPTGFPIGTLAVNAIGCFLFGFLWAMAEVRFRIGGEARVILLTGFMGALTTYSTFAFETAQMIEGSQFLAALGNVALHLVAGTFLVILGARLGAAFY